MTKLFSKRSSTFMPNAISNATTVKASVLAILLTSFGVNAVHASSHREAPNITRYPTLDSSDFYMFNSYEANRSDFVTIIANYVPLQDAYGGPNYFPMDSAAKYNIHIDNNGDGMEDLTFQFDFKQMLTNDSKGTQVEVGPEGDKKLVSVPPKNTGPVTAGDNAALNFNETYTVQLITGPAKTGVMASVAASGNAATTEFVKPYDYIGDKTFTDAAGYQAYADQYNYEVAIPNCATAGRVFVGQRKDSFVVNLGETFDLVNYVPVEGDSAPGAGDANGFPSGITQDPANDDLVDKNVTTIAMEIPKSCLTSSSEEPVIGAWTTAELPQVRIQNPAATFDKPEVNGGALTQVSRLGNPLVNELVIGVADKDRFSTSKPMDDGQFIDYVTNPSLPLLLNTLFLDGVNTLAGANFTDLAPTKFPRSDLVDTFLRGFPGVNRPTVFADGQTEVVASEMLRLNTGIDAAAAADQNTLGVIAGDLAGFPNGRRPGDDVVDVALRVVMGGLCYDIPLPAGDTNLGYCVPEDAQVGNQPFTDGAPISASDFDESFPYLKTPLAGSPN